jgi:membrane peptidoglycan carboxypeptidase
MMELSQSYLQLANTGTSIPKIRPIRSITSQGVLVPLSSMDTQQKRYISLTATDMLWKILSHASYMPTTWYRLHNLPLQHFALKTGTTDKKV